MASTLAQIARERKAQLRQLMVASRKLDAAQESLEREVKRIMVRKRAVPELADAERLAQMTLNVESALAVMASVISSLGMSWGSRF